MRLYIFYFFIACFIAVWIFIFKPYEISQKYSSKKILLKDFTYIQKDKEVVSIFLRAKKGEIEDKVMRAGVVEIDFLDKNSSLLAKNARYMGDVLYLGEDVKFLSQKFNFFTQKANYFVKKGILKVPLPFRYVSKEINATGSSLVYYKRAGKIMAKNIKARVVL